jgi:putative protease
MKKNTKTELLLPAGSKEAFFAAIEGGADAVYMGTRAFNARQRAQNFTFPQILNLIKIAHRNQVKVYITLNTLIKNKEIPELIKTLAILDKVGLDALIIQDWGVYYLAKKLFPKLVLHTSTQIGTHNSLGAEFARKAGFERVILGRELTEKEIKDISHKSKIELEIFIHGALCYSFSGYCLFSSFLGGMSANRGQCRQPCRRIYETPDNSSYLFNLKDFQLIEKVPEMVKMGIASLKIEGRMKSAEYVYQTASAYRKALDDFSKINEAESELEFDMGRQKTEYFWNNEVGSAISELPFAGKLIGKVKAKSGDYLEISSTLDLKIGDRLRILPDSGEDTKPFKITEIKLGKGNVEFLEAGKTGRILCPVKFKKDEKVFLIGIKGKKFAGKIRSEAKNRIFTKNYQPHPMMKKHNKAISRASAKMLIVRIDSINWLKKLYLPAFDNVILNLAKVEWETFDFNSNFIKKNITRFVVELPKFIAESQIEFYRQLINKADKAGFKTFSLSHLSQKEFFSKIKNVKLWTNENVYTLNDFAISGIKEFGITETTYPLETDMDNLIRGKSRNGILPVYFYPHLFYSRMPICNPGEISDRTGKYSTTVKDGFTIVYPDRPVSFLQNIKKLRDKGFNKFLIDLSLEKVSKNTANKILKHYKESKALDRAYHFNMKKGLW